jgi:hypothetical protein
MSRLTPQQVWHERLQRALDRESFSRAVRDWAHDLLVLRAHQSEFMRFSDDGRPPKRWPNTAAGDHDATERATMELMDRIGVHVGHRSVPAVTGRRRCRHGLSVSACVSCTARSSRTPGQTWTSR